MSHRSIFSAALLTVWCAGLLAAAEPAIGSAPPEFGGKQFYNVPTMMSSPVTLAGLRGRVVLIDFWATWCGPCVASIPHLIELHNKYADQGLVIIGHTDGSSKAVDTFIKSENIPYIISIGDDIGDAYGVSGIPHVYVIGPDGNVAWHGHPGAMKDQTITELLKNVRISATPVPQFAKPSTVDKVARVEAGIATGKVGAGVKTLVKLSEDKDSAVASAAKASLEIITTWKAKIDDELSKQQQAGDVYHAAELATRLATSYAGHDETKTYQALASELKKNSDYAAGKEFQKLTAIPAEGRKDPRFIKMAEAFLKKFPTGYYADEARKLTK